MSAAAEVIREGTSAHPRIPRALPAWVYHHPEMTRLEIERILKPAWQIVCHLNSLPKSGDYVTFDLGPESVFALRDRSGAVRAFHNVCRHRGARLLDGAGSCPATITCPYHGWSYRQDGSCLGMPLKDSFPGLDRGEFGLKPVRTEVFLGFVFVALAGDPPPLAKTWGRLAEELAPYRTEELMPIGPIRSEVWDVDWKIAMDNYLESYHVPVGHPGLARMFTFDYEDQASVPGIGRGISWLRDQPSSRWSERAYQSLMRSVELPLPEAQRTSWRFYSMLPNLGLDLFPDQMDFFQLLPIAPGKCLARYGLFARPDERREVKAMRYLSNRINRAVNAEDRWLCERVQRGLASSSYEPGPLSALEGWVLEFHNLIRSKIPEARLLQAPERFA
jgi:phenylpropionate dioxygenase-like ring-hydroxylating dioxygenase large terminal subunit